MGVPLHLLRHIIEAESRLTNLRLPPRSRLGSEKKVIYKDGSESSLIDKSKQHQVLSCLFIIVDLFVVHLKCGPSFFSLLCHVFCVSPSVDMLQSLDSML